MAWVTPKTDWASSNGVTTTDMNRIEGDISFLQALNPDNIKYYKFTGTISSGYGLNLTSVVGAVTNIVGLWGVYLNTASFVGGNYYTPIGGSGTASGVDCKVSSAGVFSFEDIETDANGKSFVMIVAYL
jgi:hypothetical protein